MNGRGDFSLRARRGITAGLAAAILVVGCAASCASASSPLKNAYEKILGVLRQPTADGAVVMDQELPPALLAAGLRPGDIIRRIDGRRVITRQRWQQLTASVADNSAKLEIVRDGRNAIITVGPQIAGLHIWMVRAGVAAPFGPVPDSRADVNFNWGFLHRAAGAVTNPCTHRWFLLRQDHYVVGALHLRVTRRLHGWLLDWNLIAVSGGPLLAQRWRIRFYPGDGQRAPAFTLVGLERDLIHNTLRVISRGRKLQLYPAGRHIWSAHGAVPMPAIFLLADALVGHKGTTADISEIGFSRLATRYGCTLRIGPTEAVTIGGVDYRARLVDLHWLARRQARFYFAGHRLIAADLQGGLSAIRIASRAIARDVIGKRRWVEVANNATIVPAKGKH